MFEAIGHFLFQTRAPLSLAGLFGAISLGYWLRGRAIWYQEKRKPWDLNENNVVFTQTNRGISSANVYRHSKNLIEQAERRGNDQA